MNNILTNKYLRRAFWIACCSVLVVLGFIKYLFIGELIETSPHWLKFASGMMEALVAAIITTIGVGSFIFYLTPKLDPKYGTEFLSSNEFNDYFNSVLKATNEWHFRGGFGRYLRTTVLPSLNKIASDNRSPVTIKAQILNPKNDKLCQLHADLRNSVKNVDNKKDWTIDDVKENLYSTIVACAIYESNNQYLDISVFLNNFFSTDRVDICTDYGIVTKEDRKVPGLKFSKDSSHYRAYLGDLSVTQKQADVVNKLPKKWTIGKLQGGDVEKILEELGFAESAFQDENYARVASIVNKGENPYA